MLSFRVIIYSEPRRVAQHPRRIFPFPTLLPSPVYPDPRRARSFQRSDAQFASRMGLRDVATCGRSDLSHLESTVEDKLRVLPVFSRNRPFSSPLEATLMSILVSVASKGFTAKVSPLESALTKNSGGGGLPTFEPSNLQTRQRAPSVPLQPKPSGATMAPGTRILRDPGKQLRSPRCLRIVSGHRELLNAVPDCNCKSCLGPAF
jgi:hypothetical protein